MRTIISLSAIAFGVTALMIAGGFTQWIFWAIRDAAILNGLGHIQITRPGFRAAGFADPMAYLLPPASADLDVVRAAPHVEVVDQRLVLSGLASNGDRTIAFTGEAVAPDADRRIFRVLVPITGNRLASADPNGVLLGRGLAAALGVEQGDKVSFIVNIPGGGINGVEGRVRGLFATGVKAYDDNAVRMPIALGRKLLRVQGSQVWVVGLSTTKHTDETVSYLRARLPQDRFEVASWFELSDFYRKTVALLSRQIDVVALLIGVIIVLGTSNTLMMNVLERTGEIGTLLAMGTPRNRVLRLFMLEGTLLGVVGGVGGLLIGFLLAEFLSYIGIPMPPPPGRVDVYSAKIMLTVSLAVSAFVMAVGSATIASFYPALKASRLPIVDALRHNR